MKTSTTIGMSQNRGSSSFIIHASWKKIANFSHWEFFAPTALVMWFFGGFRGLPVWVGRLLPSTARPLPCPHVANGVSLYLLKCANVVSSCMSPQKKSQPRPRGHSIFFMYFYDYFYRPTVVDHAAGWTRSRDWLDVGYLNGCTLVKQHRRRHEPVIKDRSTICRWTFSGEENSILGQTPCRMVSTVINNGDWSWLRSWFGGVLFSSNCDWKV